LQQLVRGANSFAMPFVTSPLQQLDKAGKLASRRGGVLRSKTRTLLAGVAFLALAVTPAQASFTTWEVNEVFSNADGTIQFIEFFESNGQDGQRSFTGKDLKTFVAGAAPNDFLNRYLFTADVSSSLTANKFALIATSGFASLPGAVPPDFVMPDGFIDTSVVVKITLSTIDEFTFSQGAIPTNGFSSLNRTGTPVSANSPTNFAGQTGNIDVPEPAVAALEAAALLCLLGIVQIRRAVGVRHYPASTRLKSSRMA
jgi:hypothetical protein